MSKRRRVRGDGRGAVLRASRPSPQYAELTAGYLELVDDVINHNGFDRLLAMYDALLETACGAPVDVALIGAYGRLEHLHAPPRNDDGLVDPDWLREQATAATRTLRLVETHVRSLAREVNRDAR